MLPKQSIAKCLADTALEKYKSRIEEAKKEVPSIVFILTTDGTIVHRLDADSPEQGQLHMSECSRKIDAYRSRRALLGAVLVTEGWTAEADAGIVESDRGVPVIPEGTPIRFFLLIEAYGEDGSWEVITKEIKTAEQITHQNPPVRPDLTARKLLDTTYITHPENVIWLAAAYVPKIKASLN